MLIARTQEAHVDKSLFQDWLDRYVEAWQSYDADRIAELFSADATYLYHPWDADPLRGRDRIVSDWVDNKDAEGSWRASYSAVACDDDICVATGKSEYLTEDRASVDKTYWNVFVCRFDTDDRCSSFTEYFMEQPKPKS
jgi:ketosteroid isomerase-like protein